MALMVFTDKMMSGVAEIDAQHRALIDIINGLYAIALGKPGHRPLGDVLEDLSAYLAGHLAYEEDLFVRTDFPGAAKHKAEHEHLRKKIAAYKAASGKGGDMMVALDLLHFLKQWLTAHIQVADKEACAHFNRHGIS